MRKEIKILIGAAATLAVGAAVFFALSGWLEEKYRLYENYIWQHLFSLYRRR